MSNFEQFYKAKRVLVTGATGFKGSWLSLWLSDLGAEVFGYSLERPVSTPNMFSSLDLGQYVHNIAGDVTDFGVLLEAFGDANPEIVFHLAAQPLVSESYRDPLRTLATNIMGTANVLEAIRQTRSIKVVVIVTTDKVYANNEDVYPYRETDPLGGHDPYSMSKSCAELVTESYRTNLLCDRDDLTICTARAGNVIGGGDWGQDRLVPDIVTTLAADGSVALRHPESVRPWQHVLEPLSGYLMLAHAGWNDRHMAGPWNLGPPTGEMISVGELTDRLIAEWGSAAAATKRQESTFLESNMLRLDNSKAMVRLGWRPTWAVDQAVRTTVEWYRAYYHKADVEELRAITRQQIRDYVHDMT